MKDDPKPSGMERIKLLAIKKFMPIIMDFIEPLTEKLSESKENAKLIEDEIDIVLVLFIQNKKAYGSICTINEENHIKRQLHTAPIKEFLEKLF